MPIHLSLVISFADNCKALLESLLNLICLLFTPMRWRSGWSVRFAVDRPGIYFHVESYQKTLKNGIQFPCLSFSIIGIVWRTSRQASLFCSWARHLTGCLHLLYMWQTGDGAKQFYPSWRPSMTKIMQT